MLGALFRWLAPRPAPRASPISATGAGTPHAAIIQKAEREILVLAQKHCAKATVFSFGAVDIDPQHLAIWITTLVVCGEVAKATKPPDRQGHGHRPNPSIS